MTLDPHDAMAWNNKANNLAALDRTDEALACYERALVLDPGYANAWYNKAHAELEVGRPRDAARSYERYIALAPARDTVRIEYARQRLRELR